jgi:hypothetical protein
MEMWNCDKVDKTGSAVWGFGIDGTKPLVSARLSEIFLHPIPVTSIITSRILVSCNNTET